MAGKNFVNVTFAGDTAQLEKSFDKVDEAADGLEKSVKKASRATDDHANATARLGEKADNSERNLIGVHDVIDGTATIMQGPGKQGIVAYVQGWADLAGGAAPLLMSLSALRLATIRQTIAQWASNSAILASPITWIIAGIVLLVAAVVLIATKTDWFQRGWKAAWAGIKIAAKAVYDWFIGPLVTGFKKAWDTITGLPGKLKTAFGKVKDYLFAPFKAAFNAIADAWNSTVGRLSFHIPDWVPKFGGKGFDVPDIPKFHSGGVVPGAPGSEMLAILQAGETVSPAGGGTTVIQLHLSGSGSLASAFLGLMRSGDIKLTANGVRVVPG